MDFLDGNARTVALEVLAQEERERRHLVVALSGAHAYGFPSPDSDLDLKGIHIAPTRALLALDPAGDTANRLEVIDGVEIDYTSNELRPVLVGLLAGNGNYLERVIGALVALAAPELAELRALVPGCLSRRYHRHYRGFAASQRRELDAAEQPTAKKLLYVLRTALTGAHLLLTGELRVDLTTVADRYGYSDALSLIEAKKQGERVVLDDATRRAWQPRLDALFTLLDQACEESVLPEAPAGAAALNTWLLDIRGRHFVT
ncbi:MAG TPA: nucleotidyltransferase domain-containing protein [Kofleriaceae bacterium]|nr:nucleotidyltransferase domain-containing protein [Kofleriaceae bacterium]